MVCVFFKSSGSARLEICSVIKPHSGVAALHWGSCCRLTENRSCFSCSLQSVFTWFSNLEPSRLALKLILHQILLCSITFQLSQGSELPSVAACAQGHRADRPRTLHTRISLALWKHATLKNTTKLCGTNAFCKKPNAKNRIQIRGDTCLAKILSFIGSPFSIRYLFFFFFSKGIS